MQMHISTFDITFTWTQLYFAIGLLVSGHGAWHTAHRTKTYWKFLAGSVLWFTCWPLIVLLRLFIVALRRIDASIESKETHRHFVTSGTFNWSEKHGLNVVMLPMSKEPEVGDYVSIEEILSYGNHNPRIKKLRIGAVLSADGTEGVQKGHVLCTLDRDNML